MATTAFARTFARLLSDRGGLTRTLLAVGLLLLGGWYFWADQAHVTLYEVSSEAWVELDAAAWRRICTTWPRSFAIAVLWTRLKDSTGER